MTECKHRFKTISKRFKQYECRLCGFEVETDKFCEDCRHCEEIEQVTSDYHSSDGIKVIGHFMGCWVGRKDKAREIYEGAIGRSECEYYEEW